MDINIKQLLEATNGESLTDIREKIPIEGISTDTRTIKKNEAFFALVGEKFDGHSFLEEAVKKGAKHLVVSDPKSASFEDRASVHVVSVENTLRAYGDLAQFYKTQFNAPAIAITGSSGKTTVKEILAHFLAAHFKVLKNQGTENNLIGVPKTLFELEALHDLIVLEMGTSQPGEIERLSEIIHPDLAIITQIGPSHLEGLKDIDRVGLEKLSLLKNLKRGGVLIVNGEDSRLSETQSGVHKVLKVGFSKEKCDWVADRLWCHQAGATFYVEGMGQFQTKLIGKHNILNCLLAIAAATTLGVDAESIRKNLASFEPVSGRLLMRSIDGIHFLDDSYNSNPDSFKAALETLKEFKIREKKGVVCGDMLELGNESEKWHRWIGALIADLLFDFVIAAGPESKHLVDEAIERGFDPARIYHAKNSVQAGRICQKLTDHGDLVLVKGSRGTQMEKIFECFTTSSIH